jgi:hypothetical protein
MHFSEEITVKNSYSLKREEATDTEKKPSFSRIWSWKQGKYGLVFTLVFGLSFGTEKQSKRWSLFADIHDVSSTHCEYYSL